MGRAVVDLAGLIVGWGAGWESARASRQWGSVSHWHLSRILVAMLVAVLVAAQKWGRHWVQTMGRTNGSASKGLVPSTMGMATASLGMSQHMFTQIR